jgi:hypothetical protein
VARGAPARHATLPDLPRDACAGAVVALAAPDRVNRKAAGGPRSDDSFSNPKVPPGWGPSDGASCLQCNTQPSSFAMRCTVPVPSPSDLATFKIPTPFASCFRTFRSVALSIFGRPSFTPWATARLSPALIRCRIIVRSNSANAPVSLKTSLPMGVVVSMACWSRYKSASSRVSRC